MPTTRASGHGHYLAHDRQRRHAAHAARADIDLQTLRLRRGDRRTTACGSRCIRPATCSARRRCGSNTAAAVWVASGDYKTEPDGTCAPFEPVRCDTFITESTFGLPIYRWPPQAGALRRDQRLVARQRRSRAGRRCCSATPSARRSASCTAWIASIGPIVVHGAVEPLNEVYRAAGVALPPTLRVTDPGVDAALLKRALVLAPPSAQGTPWMRRFGNYADAFASGWMQLRGTRRRRGVDRGFVMSDHADWPGLQQAIAGTGAERVFVTHGSVAVLVRWLRENGPGAQGFKTEYGDEDDGRRAKAAAEAPAAGRAERRMKAFAALYRELDATTSSLAKQAALQRYLQRAAPAGRRLGGVLPGRRQAAPAGADQAAARCWRRRPPACPNGCSTRATRPSATWPRPSRCCCRRRPSTHDLGLARLDRAAPAAAAQDAARGARRRAARAVARSSRPDERLRVLQAHHRRLPRRRVAAAGHAGAGGGRRHRRQARRAAADGLHRTSAASPTPRDYAALIAPESDRRARPADQRPALSVLPGASVQLPLEQFDALLGAARRLDRRMEVGRHPRAAGQARRRRSGCGRAARSW